VSFNPDEVYPANNTNAVFYNCADIAIQEPSATPRKKLAAAQRRRPATQVHRAPKIPPPDDSCCAPSQFHALATTNNLQFEIYYDGTRQLVRIDRSLSGEILYSTITNYSDPNLPEVYTRSRASTHLTRSYSTSTT
jgi:hypothetical protein